MHKTSMTYRSLISLGCIAWWLLAIVLLLKGTQICREIWALHQAQHLEFRLDVVIIPLMSLVFGTLNFIYAAWFTKRCIAIMRKEADSIL